MKTWHLPQLIDVAHKLSQDFAHQLTVVTDAPQGQQPDPLLAVMFHSFAAQVAKVYDQAKEAMPQAVLSELIAGLDMPERNARAAQTVVKFSLPPSESANKQNDAQAFDAGTQFIGEGELRERLTFALDTPLAVSRAQIAFAAIYQDGALRWHQGTALGGDFATAQPAKEAVPVDLGPSPALFLAIEIDEAQHLSQHGFFFDLNINKARDVLAHLAREVWCLLDDTGSVSAAGLLRPVPGNGGVRRLVWLQGETQTLEPAGVPRNAIEAAVLPEGAFGRRVFVLPEIPPERRFLVSVPKQMHAPLRRIFQAVEKSRLDALLTKRRAWIRIGLPRDVPTVGADLARVVLHCTTASNVEVLNQKITFAIDGQALPVTNGGERQRQLINALSIKGEHGAAYLPETEPNADAWVGRYRLRQERLELTPGCSLRGQEEDYATVRLQLTNGALGNSTRKLALQPRPGARKQAALVEVENLTEARGGSDGETFEDGKRRFTELLLSRERPVTLPDLEAFVRGFEPKIRGVRVAAALERRAVGARNEGGLQRVQRIIIQLERETFALAEFEAEVLQRELQAELQRRTLLGLEVRVVIEWLN